MRDNYTSGIYSGIYCALGVPIIPSYAGEVGLRCVDGGAGNSACQILVEEGWDQVGPVRWEHSS